MTTKYGFHALYPGKDGVSIHSTNDYELIEPNAIDDVYAELIDADVRRSMEGLGR